MEELLGIKMIHKLSATKSIRAAACAIGVAFSSQAMGQTVFTLPLPATPAPPISENAIEASPNWAASSPSDRPFIPRVPRIDVPDIMQETAVPLVETPPLPPAQYVKRSVPDLTAEPAPASIPIVTGAQPPTLAKPQEQPLPPAAPTPEPVGDYVADSEYEAAVADTVARELKYGEPAPSQTRAFLRRQTPLLNAGQCQIDYGLQYSVFEADFPTLIGTTLAEANVTSRRIETLLGFRYGVTDHLQFFTNTTVGWQQTEFFDGVNYVNEDTGGIGDLNFGVNYLLQAESACLPALIVSVDATAPTGNDVDQLLLTDAGMGAGVWATSTSLLAVKSIDPVVLFWGGGYRHTFEDSFRNNQIDLGNQFFYNCGIGFAANERVTLSAAYTGAFVTDFVVNQNIIEGSAFDIGSMRFAATIFRCNKIYEPFVNIGATDRTPSTTFGIVFTR